jgi:hypothetical protein
MIKPALYTLLGWLCAAEILFCSLAGEYLMALALLPVTLLCCAGWLYCSVEQLRGGQL